MVKVRFDTLIHPEDHAFPYYGVLIVYLPTNEKHELLEELRAPIKCVHKPLGAEWGILVGVSGQGFYRQKRAVVKASSVKEAERKLKEKQHEIISILETAMNWNGSKKSYRGTEYVEINSFQRL